MGRLDGRLVFLLPGNPVSCLCAYDFFAGRAIRAWAAARATGPIGASRRGCRASLFQSLAASITRGCKFNGTSAEPLAISGASVLSSVTRADGFVIVPMDSEGFPEGAEVEVFLYDGTGDEVVAVGPQEFDRHVTALTHQPAYDDPMSSQEQFLNVIDRDEAEARFRAALDLEPLGIEQVSLADALGRVLAADVVARVDVPSFDRSNFDGFAVHAADTFGASELAPRSVKLLPATIDAGVTAPD